MITYEIKAVGLKDFIYRSPLIFIDQYGDLKTKTNEYYDSIYIKNITLIFKIGRDNKGQVVFSEPLDIVNIFLLSLHIDNEQKDSQQYSKALINYFSFILLLQKKWEEGSTHLPKPDWNVMPIRKNQRPTYQYRSALKYSVIEEKDSQLKLARSTATAYMRAVVAFYRFYLRREIKFDNPPFEHEIVNLSYTAGATSMKSYLTKQVHTTDLRLNFGKNIRNNGTSSVLQPLTNIEWTAVEEVLLKGRIIKNVHGALKWHSLAYEYSLFFRLTRYTGMRRVEVSSLHLNQLPEPYTETRNALIKMDIGETAGSLTKGKGNNPPRTIHIPINLMKEVIEYSRSERYMKRLDKYHSIYEQTYKDNTDVDRNKKYLFMSATGKPFFTVLAASNNRWTEIRNTVRYKLKTSFIHKAHNLRSTYAVAIFRALLKKYDSEQALSYVNARLGHAEIATTMLYLKIAQDEPTGDEIYEDVLDFLGIFDEQDTTIFG